MSSTLLFPKEYRILILGAPGVGKSSLIQQFTNRQIFTHTTTQSPSSGSVSTTNTVQEFLSNNNNDSYYQIRYYRITRQHKNRNYRLLLIDAPSSIGSDNAKEKENVLKREISTADGFVLVFAVNNENSYQELMKIIQQIHKFREKEEQHDHNHGQVMNNNEQNYEIISIKNDHQNDCLNKKQFLISNNKKNKKIDKMKNNKNNNKEKEISTILLPPIMVVANKCDLQVVDSLNISKIAIEWLMTSQDKMNLEDKKKSSHSKNISKNNNNVNCSFNSCIQFSSLKRKRKVNQKNKFILFVRTCSLMPLHSEVRDSFYKLADMIHKQKMINNNMTTTCMPSSLSQSCICQ